MSYREFNPTIGELPPVFNNSCVLCVRRPMDDFASLPAGSFNG
jgi:hypothetical protein